MTVLLPSHNELVPTAEAALAAYGFKATVITPIRSWNTPIFRVDTTAGSYALRLHRPGFRSEAHLRGELALLKHLASFELAVPVPVSTSTGELLLTLEVDGVPSQYCDVTTWIEGEVRRQLEPVNAYQLGIMLARIHLAARAFVLPADAALPHYDAVSLLTETSPYNPGPLGAWFSRVDLEVIREVALRAQPVLQLAHEEGEVGPIHNDLILGNCLWHGDEVRVLDFADCGVGPYLYDLAPMLTNFSDETSVREGFLEGYLSLRPLSSKHREALPPLEAVRHVRVCLWAIGKAQRGEVAPPLERHLEVRMSEIHKLMSN